jgi:hypothetical protein
LDWNIARASAFNDFDNDVRTNLSTRTAGGDTTTALTPIMNLRRFMARSMQCELNGTQISHIAWSQQPEAVCVACLLASALGADGSGYGGLLWAQTTWGDLFEAWPISGPSLTPRFLAISTQTLLQIIAHELGPFIGPLPPAFFV